MKQLADEVRVRLIELCVGNHADTFEDSFKEILEIVLDLPDTAQPVQVNAGYGELEANMDRRARTCLRELVAALQSMEQAITDPENQPSQFGTVLLVTHQALEAEVERLKVAAKYAEHIDATPENQWETMLHDALTERDALRAQLAAAQGPVAYQFQTTKDGVWHPFADDKHYRNTVEDGRWPIRALYAAPIPQQPAQPVFPFVPWSKEKEMVESWTAQQAQPERAPLSDDEIQTIYLRTYNEGFHGRNLEIAFARAIEAAIKQGGQHD